MTDQQNPSCNICKCLLTHVAIIVTFTLTLLLSPLLISIILPVYLCRLIVRISSKCSGSGLGAMIPTRSAIFASDPIYSQPLMVNVAKFVFDGVIDLRTLEISVDQNWVQARAPSSGIKYPELKQYVTIFGGFFFWKNDENFNIKNHVKLYFNQKPGNYMSDLEVNEAWNELSMKPFELHRSPWEIILIPSYRQNRNDNNEAVKSVMIFRWHHALADGFSILNLLGSISDVNLSLVARAARRKPANWCLGICKKIKLFFIGPYLLLTLLATKKDQNSWHLKDNKMTRYWHLGVGKNVPIKIVHDVKTNFNVSFAGVLLTAVAAAVRKLMVKGFESNGVKTIPKYISCGVPFPLPNHPDKLRNHWAICTVNLPVGEENPVRRLQIINKNLTLMRSSSKPIIAYSLAPWLGGLPAFAIKSLVKNDITTVVTSIMPGPPEKISNFVGHSVLDACYIIGCGPGRNGCSFSVLSYNGSVKFAVTVDSALSPDVKIAQDLMLYVEEELDLLKQICV